RGADISAAPLRPARRRPPPLADAAARLGWPDRATPRPQARREAADRPSGAATHRPGDRRLAAPLGLNAVCGLAMGQSLTIHLTIRLTIPLTHSLPTPPGVTNEMNPPRAYPAISYGEQFVSFIGATSRKRERRFGFPSLTLPARQGVVRSCLVAQDEV